MTTDERVARLQRIRDMNMASNDRVRDFINLVAKMCCETTARRKRHSDPTPSGPLVLLESPAADEVKKEPRDREVTTV